MSESEANPDYMDERHWLHTESWLLQNYNFSVDLNVDLCTHLYICWLLQHSRHPEVSQKSWLRCVVKSCWRNVIKSVIWCSGSVSDCVLDLLSLWEVYDAAAGVAWRTAASTVFHVFHSWQRWRNDNFTCWFWTQQTPWKRDYKVHILYLWLIYQFERILNFLSPYNVLIYAGISVCPIMNCGK